jgi:hypothetical protein
MRLRDLVLVAIALIGVTTPANAQAVRTTCDPDEQPFFICETNRKEKYVAICATEVEVGKRWSAIQYRYGPEDRAELLYPQNAREGATKLFFSHVEKGTMYIVSVRFKSGGFTYLVESAGDSASDPIGNGAAGVTVTDANGKTVADIHCIERPTLFAPYMQMALACDLENPHGKAACGKDPLHLPAQRNQTNAPRKSVR